jgi:hypothetical protein
MEQESNKISKEKREELKKQTTEKNNKTVLKNDTLQGTK